MAESHELISLMAFTLGSIGQVVKDQSTLRHRYNDEEALHEVKRIYDGYIAAIIYMTKQVPMKSRVVSTKDR